MRKLFFILILFSFTFCFSQNEKETTAKKVITDFFDAFHKKDTTKLSIFCHKEILLQSVIASKGKKRLVSETRANFLKSIASIPNDATFEEKLLDFKVEVLDDMVVVATPYEFYYKGKKSHSGTNVFTISYFDNEPKIMHIIDTRLY